MSESVSTDQVTLESLVGEHELSGVDMNQLAGDAENCSFVLDGTIYTASEDPVDGYRSCLGELVRGGTVANQFTPCRVLCSMDDEVLVMRDLTTGKDVLSIGTGNADDYYPYFVANFDPTAMAINTVKP